MEEYQSLAVAATFVAVVYGTAIDHDNAVLFHKDCFLLFAEVDGDARLSSFLDVYIAVGGNDDM